MRKFKRSIAAIAAMATAISAMSIASFAEGETQTPATEGQSSLTGSTVTGSGTFEGTVESVKYNMILPTTPAAGFYDFILDPQGLIEETGADRFGDAYDADDFADNKFLFFKNTTSTPGTTVTTYTAAQDIIKSETVNVEMGEITEEEYNAIPAGDDKTNKITVDSLGEPVTYTVTEAFSYTKTTTLYTDGDTLTAEQYAALDPTFQTAEYVTTSTSTGAATAAVTYSDESDVLTAYNLSSMEVKLTVEGTAKGASDLTFVETAPSTEGKSIMLAIADAAATSTTASNKYFKTDATSGVTTATYEATLAAVDDSNFAVTWDSAKGYQYGYTTTFATAIANEGYKNLTSGDTKVASAGFKLIGAIAEDEDGSSWKGYTGTPSVEVVWSMADPTAQTNEAPNIAGSTAKTLTSNKTGHTVTIDLGEGNLKATGLAATDPVQYALGTTTTFKALASNYTFDATTGVFTINATAAGLLTDGSRIKITLNDTAGTTITLTFED